MTNELVNANDQYLYLDYEANQASCQQKKCVFAKVCFGI